MYGGSSSGLTDLLERLPGRPWWWGAGLGLLLVVVLVFSLRNVGQGGVHIARPGDNFSEQEPTPPKKPGALNTEKPRLPARTVDDVAGTNGQEQHAAKKSPRAAPAAPAVLSQWNDGDFLRAREAGDPRLVAALEQRAKNPQRTPAEAEMLESLLRPAVPARRPGKRGDAAADPPAAPKLVFHAVAAALGANQTAAARQTLAGLLAGDFPEAPAEAVAEDAAVALLRQGSAQSEQIVLDHLVAAPSADRQDAVAAAVQRLRLGAAAEALGAGGHRRRAAGGPSASAVGAAVRAEPAELGGPGAALSKRVGRCGDAHGVGEAACRGQHGGAAGVAGPGRGAGGGRAAPAQGLLPRGRTTLGAAPDGLPRRATPGPGGDGGTARRDRPGADHPQSGPPQPPAADLVASLVGRAAGPAGGGCAGAVLVEPAVPAVLKSLLRESQRTRIAAYKAAARSSYGHGGGRPTASGRGSENRPKHPPIATGTS